MAGVLPEFSEEPSRTPLALHVIAERRQHPGARVSLAELALRLTARFVVRESLAHELVGAHIEVKAELVGDVATDLGAGLIGETEEPLGEPGAHGSYELRVTNDES